MRARLLLADDHSITLAGMRAVISREHNLVSEVGDGQALVQQALHLRPDLIILDIGMPLLNGIEAAKKIRHAWPGAKLLFVSMHANHLYVREAMASGASGYVLKTSAAEELLPAIQAVLSGGKYVTPALGLDPAEIFAGSKATAGLTERQREVLQLVAEGHSSKEIAAILGTSVKTVSFHRDKLKKRLGLHSVAELTAFATRHGFVSG